MALTSLDFSWMMEQILDNDGNVVLDLGFTTKAQRSTFVERAKRLGVAAEVHYLEAPTTLRRKRVERRNREKDPRVFSFEVTRQMFDFMEPRFERPSAEEMQNGKRIEIVESPD